MGTGMATACRGGHQRAHRRLQAPTNVFAVGPDDSNRHLALVPHVLRHLLDLLDQRLQRCRFVRFGSTFPFLAFFSPLVADAGPGAGPIPGADADFVAEDEEDEEDEEGAPSSEAAAAAAAAAPASAPSVSFCSSWRRQMVAAARTPNGAAWRHPPTQPRLGLHSTLSCIALLVG